VGVQEVRWDKGGTVSGGDYNFFLWKRKCRLSIGNKFFLRGGGVHHRIVRAVKKVEFVTDRMSCIVLRGRWCNIIVLNVHALRDEKRDDSKDRSHEEVEQIFFIIFLSTI
jgi:hypothetical protein